MTFNDVSTVTNIEQTKIPHPIAFLPKSAQSTTKLGAKFKSPSFVD
ncbi:hypothetical protein ABIS04_14555 [Shewanella sp. H8]